MSKVRGWIYREYFVSNKLFESKDALRLFGFGDSSIIKITWVDEAENETIEYERKTADDSHQLLYGSTLIIVGSKEECETRKQHYLSGAEFECDDSDFSIEYRRR